MAGRRQVWTGITLLLLTSALAAVLPVLERPGAGWEVVALVASAVLVSLCAARLLIAPVVAARTGPTRGPASDSVPVLFWLCPDAPGRPQPRAPGHDWCDA